MNAHSVTIYLNDEELTPGDVSIRSKHGDELLRNEHVDKVEAVRNEILEALADLTCQKHGKGVNVDIYVYAAEGVVSKFLKKLVGRPDGSVRCGLRFCCEPFESLVYNTITSGGSKAPKQADQISRVSSEQVRLLQEPEHLQGQECVYEQTCGRSESHEDWNTAADHKVPPCGTPLL